MTTYVFDRIEQRGYKVAKCSVCGRRLERQRTFGMTLNPWNRHPDGTVRSERDIREALKAEIAAWQQEPERHAKCAEPGQPT